MDLCGVELNSCESHESCKTTTQHAEKARLQTSITPSFSFHHASGHNARDARISTVEKLMREVDTQQFQIITISFLRTRNRKLEKEQGAKMEQRWSLAVKTETGRSTRPR